MHLAQLRWLEGFAATGRWHLLGGGPPLALDGLLLGRARRTVNTLRREHARALDGLVGDGTAWLGTIDGMLARLGAEVHGRAPRRRAGWPRRASEGRRGRSWPRRRGWAPWSRRR